MAFGAETLFWSGRLREKSGEDQRENTRTAIPDRFARHPPSHWRSGTRGEDVGVGSFSHAESTQKSSPVSIHQLLQHGNFYRPEFVRSRVRGRSAFRRVIVQFGGTAALCVRALCLWSRWTTAVTVLSDAIMFRVLLVHGGGFRVGRDHHPRFVFGSKVLHHADVSRWRALRRGTTGPLVDASTVLSRDVRSL